MPYSGDCEVMCLQQAASSQINHHGVPTEARHKFGQHTRRTGRTGTLPNATVYVAVRHSSTYVERVVQLYFFIWQTGLSVSTFNQTAVSDNGNSFLFYILDARFRPVIGQQTRAPCTPRIGCILQYPFEMTENQRIVRNFRRIPPLRWL